MIDIAECLLFDKGGMIRGLNIPKACAWFLENYHMVTAMPAGRIMFYQNGVYYGDVNGIGDSFIKQKFHQNWGTAVGKNGMPILNRIVMAEVIEQLKMMTYMPLYKDDANRFPNFDENLSLINMLNGIYNWETKEFLPHSPLYKSVTRIPVTYDPDAECPTIMSIIEDVLRPEDREKFLEFLGYCCYRSIMLDKVAMMLYGPARSGKSELLRMVRMMIGDNNCAALGIRELSGSDRYGLADLYGKLANVIADIDDKPLSDEGMLKKVTSGKDPIWAQRKWEHPFSFVSTAKIFISANVLPKISDATQGFYRRIEILPCYHVFDPMTDDPSRLKMIEDEGEIAGLFNVCIAKLPALLERRRFTNEILAKDVRNMYMNSANPIEGFINECVETDVVGGWATKETTYAMYVMFAKKYQVEPLTVVNFGKEFKKAMGWQGNNECESRKRIGGHLKTCWNDIRVYKPGVRSVQE